MWILSLLAKCFTVSTLGYILRTDGSVADIQSRIEHSNSTVIRTLQCNPPGQGSGLIHTCVCMIFHQRLHTAVKGPIVTSAEVKQKNSLSPSW